MMKQLDRLKYIYLELNVAPQTIESLQGSLKSLAISVSKRQLYRDLNDVGIYFLKDSERLEQRNLEHNRKVWLINKYTDATPIDNFDIDTYLLGKATLPIGISKGRLASIQKIQSLLASHLSNSKIEHNANWDGNTLMGTNFHEITYGEDFQVKLNEFIWASSNRRSMEIISYGGDSISLNQLLQFPFKFNPVKIIYHRGCFFVAGTIAATRQCIVFDIYQILSHRLTNDKFPVKEHLAIVEDNLENRFGLTNNSDEKNYMVVLEFNAVRGNYIRHFFWHHSQKFEELPGGDWKLTLRCGINRELLGWIYQWMADVKILEPRLLKDIYAQQLKLIRKAQQHDR
ncbi:helix-turn-helix transcriptional regulator [Pedobacter immunditicola]|uniref:helix-turn-helix transcriptional regulator n=1 Tax=Pedobacter immunditicola TaxID=3133440 RepID=UPI0030AC8164